MPLDDATERDLAGFARRVLREYRIPGLSLAVVSPERRLFAGGYGARDRSGNRPATPRTLYGIGDCTKSMTGLALLQVRESGMVDLDDPVTDYLDLDLGGTYPDPTLHHLLTHTSGFPSLGTTETLLARRLRHPDPGVPLGDRADFLAHVESAAGDRVGPPGERFATFDAGYELLGQVLETVTGKPYTEYVTDHVFDPLGMARSTFDDMAFSRDEDHMTQYLQDEEGDLVAASLPTGELGRPAFGVLSSVTDLATYLRAHLGDGTVDGRAVLAEDALAEAHEGHAETGEGTGTDRARAGTNTYGYGWHRSDFLGEPLVDHAGDIAVSSAYLGFLPESGLGVAVAANTSPRFSLGVVGRGLLAVLQGADPDRAVPFLARDARREALTGAYEAHAGTMTAHVEASGAVLVVHFDHPLERGKRVLTPASSPSERSERETWADDGLARYETVDESGTRETVVFERVDGGVELRVDEWVLSRQ